MIQMSSPSVVIRGQRLLLVQVHRQDGGGLGSEGAGRDNGESQAPGSSSLAEKWSPKMSYSPQPVNV